MQTRVVCAVFEFLRRRVWGLNPQLFSQPPNTLSNYVLGGSAIYSYTYNLHHNFGRTSTVEKFNPQLIFYNSNTAYVAVL